MKVNTSELKKLLTKATLNNSIETVQLTFTEDNKVTSSMISSNRDAIVQLNVDNNIIDGIKDEVEFNFRETNTTVIPFLSLLDKDEVDLKITDKMINLSSGNQKMKLKFCVPQVVSKFEGDADSGVEAFYQKELDEEFVNSFNKIKKVGSRFGFVYFTVNKGMLSIETTDKKNSASNGLSLELAKIKGVDDLVLCFEFKNFSNLIALLNGDYEDFTLSLFYVESHNAGLLKMMKADGSETYYMMSIIEEEEG